jgi:hypothetical protein
LAKKDGVIAMGKFTHELTLHGTEGVLEDRQTQLARREGCGIKASANRLLRLEKHGS